MAALLDIYFKEEVLATILKTVQAKGEKGASITISVGDEANQYGQNVSGYISQTKEQREAKANKYYVGNGKVFWTDGKIQAISKESKPAKVEDAGTIDDLPF